MCVISFLPEALERVTVLCATVQVAPDQASHLDALISGIILLLNLMPGMAYVGVHLNSGGCIADLKKLFKDRYDEFAGQFSTAKTEDGVLLSKAMQGRTYQEKLDMAWDLYAREELEKLGHTETFERAYIELEEFEMFLGSMSVFHFGARYPCFPENEEIPVDWWHARLHLYVGKRLVRVADAFEDSPAFRSANRYKDVTDEPVAKNTIDLSRTLTKWRGLLTARRYLPQS